MRWNDQSLGKDHLTERKCHENGLQSWVQFPEESIEESSEDDGLAVELAEDVLGEVTQVLTRVEGGLLSGGSGELGVDGLEGRGDSLNVFDDRGRGCLLLGFVGVGGEGAGDFVHVGGEAFDLGGQAGE